MFRVFIFFFITLFFTLVCYSQEINLQGIVKSNEGELLHLANVVVQNDSKTILAFDTTDNKGLYNIEFNHNTYPDTLIIKTSYLGYDSKVTTVTVTQQSTIFNLDFILDKRQEPLNEVVIKADPLPYLNTKNDTITYNLKKSLSGKEQDLGELLSNLPGVHINERGKIEVNGKVIDNLLINGQTFFGNQHQIATQNITPEMVEDVKFFKKYRDFTVLSESEGSLGTAMDISIKPDFLKKFKGNIDLSGGIVDSYAISGLLYNFDDTKNFTLITDWNTLNKPSITPQDFLDLTRDVRTTQDKLESSSISRRNNAGQSRLFEDLSNRVASRKLSFNALNYNFNDNDKFRIRGYGILNSDDEQKNINSIRSFVNNTIPEQAEFYKFNNSRDFGIIWLNGDWRLTKKSLLSYNINYISGDQNRNGDIRFGFNEAIERTAETNFSLDQSFEFKTELKKNIIWKIGAFSQFDKQDNSINLRYEQEQPLLQNSNSDSLFQNISFSNRTNGLNTSISRKIKSNNFKLSFTYQDQETDFTTSGEEEVLVNIKSRNIQSLNIYGNSKLLLNNWLSAKGSLGVEYLDLDRTNNVLINPSFGFNIKTSQLSTFDLNFQRSHNLIDLKSTFQNGLIKDYRTFISGENLPSNSVFRKDNYSLLFTKINSRTGGSFFALFNYSSQNNKVQSNLTITEDGVNLNNPFLGDTNRDYLGAFSNDFKLNKKDLFGYVQVDGVFSEVGTRINNESNIFEVLSLKGLISLKTKSKRTLNFETGSKIEFNSFQNNGPLRNSITTTNIKPFINLRYKKTKQFYTQLSLAYNSFISSVLEQRDFFEVSPQIRYSNKNQNWSFYIEGENILNLNELEVIENTSNSSFFEERIVRAFPGYLNLGIRYNF